MATNKMMKIEKVTKEELLSLKNIGEKVVDMIITAREEHDGTAVYVSAIAKTISEGEDHQASRIGV